MVKLIMLLTESLTICWSGFTLILFASFPSSLLGIFTEAAAAAEATTGTVAQPKADQQTTRL